MAEKESVESGEVSIAEKKAANLYERVAEIKITDVASFVFMGEVLKEVKKIVNTFEEETRPEIDQAHKLHKALIARKKRWAEKFDEAEKLAKDKLTHYVGTVESGTPLPQIEGVIFTERWSGDVTDASLLPREYLIPDIKKLEGITDVLKQETVIPGWKPRKVTGVTVRA